MAARGLTLRFFRHPFLHTGRDLENRAAFERFLAAHGYRVAPVTIDNDEYIFAGAYDRASKRGDADVVRARSRTAYVPYMEAKAEFFERNSRELFGREIRQVLLIHANMLNADRFGDLAAMFERRGYRFITLEKRDRGSGLPIGRYLRRHRRHHLAAPLGADAGRCRRRFTPTNLRSRPSWRRMRNHETSDPSRALSLLSML